MAFGLGASAVFKIDDAGGVLRDISAYVRSVKGLPGTGAVGESTTFGAPGLARSYIRGLNTATFSIEGFWDPTATTGPDAVLRGLRTATASSTVEYGPEGGTTGKRRITGECWLTSYAVDAEADSDDPIPFIASFQTTGPVTENTY